MVKKKLNISQEWKVFFTKSKFIAIHFNPCNPTLFFQTTASVLPLFFFSVLESFLNEFGGI